MFPIILGVTCAFLTVFLVAGLFAAVTLLDMTKDSSVTIVMPDLKGQQYSEEYAKSLEDSNLKITAIEYVYDKDSPSGMIVDQQPKAGERKKLKDNSHFCEVSLKISRGNETVVVPDISITEYRNAVILLEEQSLQYKIVQTFNSSILDGYVINTEPAAGTIVPKNTEITVFVSLGQEIGFTTMPDLKGKSLAEAKTLLSQSGLTLGKVTREPSASPTGVVLSQSIDVGKSIPKKYTVVDLVLSIQIPTQPLPLPTLPPATTKPVATVAPETSVPAVTAAPTTKAPTTAAPTQAPVTTAPPTAAPTSTIAPTQAPTTAAPTTTVNPSTAAASTSPASTVAPSTAVSATAAPSASSPATTAVVALPPASTAPETTAQSDAPPTEAAPLTDAAAKASANE